MKHLLTFQPDITAPDLKEAIYDTLDKIKAILTCIIFSTGFVKEEVELDNKILFDALCIANDYINKLTQFFQQLEIVQPTLHSV